jgi:peptide-methionine (S)-S-oxide reductase
MKGIASITEGRTLGSISRVLAMLVAGCGILGGSSMVGSPLVAQETTTEEEQVVASDESSEKPELALATIGGGCFWCVEAVFENVPGVKSAVSGYCGGDVENPTYEQVCTKTTGHVEVVQLTYDPSVISYAELLEIFWKTHNPTAKNKQGADEGPQYNTVIFYHDEKQKEEAEYYKERLNEEKVYSKPIVTEIRALETFYEAEEYHQDFYAKNPNQGYCAYNIPPKLEKLKKIFKEREKKAKKEPKEESIKADTTND